MLQIKTDLYRYVHYTSNVAVCNYQELIGCDVSFMVVLISERHGGLFKKHANTDISMRYMYWFFFFIQYKLKKEASGGVQSFISLSRFREYLVPLPPFAEQKRIVAKI